MGHLHPGAACAGGAVQGCHRGALLPGCPFTPLSPIVGCSQGSCILPPSCCCPSAWWDLWRGKLSSSCSQTWPYLLPPPWELAKRSAPVNFLFLFFVSFLLTFFPSGIKGWMGTMVTGWCGQPALGPVWHRAGGQQSHPPAPAPSNQTPHRKRGTCPHPPWQRWEAQPLSRHPASVGPALLGNLLAAGAPLGPACSSPGALQDALASGGSHCR